MATQAPRESAASDLTLRVTPPRVPRDLVVRARLKSDAAELRDLPAIVVQAPAGFGKTSLLAQWRREHLGRGAIVAWLSAQESDDPEHFQQGLALAVRIASGRPTFGHTLLEGAAPAGLDGITAWLAELAQSALDVVLFVDGAERLPASSRHSLTYLLHNAPPNLRIVVATRGGIDLGVGDLTSYGQCALVDTLALRFRIDETIALVRARFATRVDADTSARLHELTEGWPLGLQLALAAIARSGDPTGAAAALATGQGAQRDRFEDVLLANLDAGDVDFLTRIAPLDELHPELCRSVTGQDDAGERLARLARETPILVAVEGGEWLRMHSLAAHALRVRAARLPAAEQAALHEHASRWLASRGQLEAAAGHAFAAGARETAFDLAERCLYEGTLRRGHVGNVIDWLARVPADELDRRPRLLLAAAWALAVGERHAEAKRFVERILGRTAPDASLRCECALILGGAAVFADDPDRFAELHDPWAESPPLTDPLLLHMHANRRAFRSLLDGDPAQARYHQQNAPRGEFGSAIGYLARWGELITGLSYLWEGQVQLTESLLRPSLASAELDLGRRHPLACTLAAVLAAAVWEGDRPDEAAALLANRLDVLERHGLPEAVFLAYRTAARIAAAEGAEHRALALLEALHAVGEARNLPRLCIVSLGDQVRVHARRFRPETCVTLCQRIEATIARDDVPKGPLWRRGVELLRELALANAAVAAQDWRRAVDGFARAGERAEALRLGRVRIEAMALRAFALDRCGENAVPLLEEAAGLAATYGLARLLVDAHPALGDWARRVARSAAGAAAPPPPPVSRPAARAELRATPSMALTPKEREVLELLARNLSNKEIALAMQVGEETVKWHLKNLFGKLAAGTRKQVVRRAELLGLLETAR